MSEYTGNAATPAHRQPPLDAIVLVNLGTPDAPNPPALRRYLAEFLSDPRVIELPRPVRWLLLNLVVLRVRPARSARAYARVWTAAGSPLRIFSEALVASLRSARRDWIALIANTPLPLWMPVRPCKRAFIAGDSAL